MASSSITTRPNGNYLARYRDASGKERTKTFPRGQKAAAKQWLAERVAELAAGTWVDPNLAKQPFGVYAATWEKAQVVADGTARITDNALRLHILPVLGERPIGQIVRTEVQSLVKQLGDKKLSAGSIRNIYDVVFRVFDSAVEDRVINQTPCRKIALPKDHKGKVQPPTLDEILELREKLPEQFQILPLFLAGTGLRIGEALALDVHDVNWFKSEVSVLQQRLQSGELAPVKTPASVDPEVPISKTLMKALRKHLKAHTDGHGPLFPDEFGEPLGYRRWKALFNVAREKAGGKFTTHDLRHYCASAALANGATIVEVQHLLRHGSATITMNIYAHLVPSSDERVRKALDAALKPKPADSADSLRTEDGVSG